MSKRTNTENVGEVWEATMDSRDLGRVAELVFASICPDSVLSYEPGRKLRETQRQARNRNLCLRGYTAMRRASSTKFCFSFSLLLLLLLLFLLVIFLLLLFLSFPLPLYLLLNLSLKQTQPETRALCLDPVIGPWGLGANGIHCFTLRRILGVREQREKKIFKIKCIKYTKV